MVTNLTNLTKKQKFLEAFKLTKCNVSKACEAVNISRWTFYDWQEKYTTFAKAVKEIEDGMTDKIEVMLMTKAEQGRQRAMEFYLTNRKKDKYSNTVKNELTGADGSPLQFIIEKSYQGEDDKQQNTGEINP